MTTDNAAVDEFNAILRRRGRPEPEPLEEPAPKKFTGSLECGAKALPPPEPPSMSAHVRAAWSHARRVAAEDYE